MLEFGGVNRGSTLQLFMAVALMGRRMTKGLIRKSLAERNPRAKDGFPCRCRP